MAGRKEITDLQGLIKGSIEGVVVEQTVTSLLPPGENYGSVMYKVDFKVQENGIKKEIHAVAKCTPLNEVTQDLFNIQETFKVEIGWHTTVIPTYKEFQKAHGIEKEINFSPKFYGARISLDPNSDIVDLDAVILTENLKALGYHNVDRHLGFDLKTTQSALKNLATFHAIPIAIRQKDPNLFQRNITPYTCLFNLNKDIKEGYYKEILEGFDKIPQCKHVLDRVHEIFKKSTPFSTALKREPWITVAHHDFWCNNIMVTKEEQPKIMILDLQIPSLGSPAADLIFFLLTSVNLDIIRDRLDSFIKFYFNELISNLEELGISTELFSYEDFLTEIDLQAQEAQYVHGLWHTYVIMNEKGQVDFDSADANFKVEDLNKSKIQINDRHIAKFAWITLEAAKRNWI